MKWYKNLKISAKLITGFLIVALIAGCVGAFGIISLEDMNKRSNQIFTSYGESQGYLGYVLGEFQKQRALLRDIVIYEDLEKTESAANGIATSDTSLQKNLEKFKETCTTEESLALYKDIQMAMGSYVETRDEVIEAGKQGDFDEAKTLLASNNCALAVSALSTAIYKAVSSDAAAANTEQANQQARMNWIITVMIIVVALAVASAIVLGIFVARMISKPIRLASEVADQVASGDTDITKTAFEQKDEIGKLFASMRGIIKALQALTSDAEILTEAAARGDLSVRADASKHEGEYRKIVEGMNGTLDAIVEPIKEAMTSMQAMSLGDLERSIQGDYKGDFGRFKDSMNSTIDQLKRVIGEISETLGEMSGGNLNVGISSEYQGDFIRVKESINDIINSLNETMAGINTAAEQVTSGTQQVSAGSQEISQGATEQAGSIEELTASVTQIAEQTRQNAVNAGNANKLTIEAKNNAAQGSEQMRAMQRAMEDINESSANISKIIRVIDDIAFQTNILALNAAVEAARAGMHGKGFAVVAEEVRNLAAKSADAAKQTTELIEGSIKKTAAGTRMADETATALSKIVDSVEKAAQLVADIASASNEQAAAITQVNRGIEQMSQVVQTNSATSEEAAAAAEELSSQAELLKDMVRQFTLREYSITGQPETSIAPILESEDQFEDSPVIDLNDTEYGKY